MLWSIAFWTSRARLQPDFSLEKVPSLLDQSLKVAQERWPESKVELEKTLCHRFAEPIPGCRAL